MRRKDRFRRKRTATRPYRKRFLVVTEGAETEPRYFQCFRNQVALCMKFARPTGKNSPRQLLARMEHFIKAEGLEGTDEAWIVVDTDQWEVEQLQALVRWSQGNDRYHIAVSNPQFEYWILLHFEDGNGIATQRDCLDRLEKVLPTFRKNHVECDKLLPGVSEAIRRARLKDQSACEDWPRVCGTTVYRLIEKMVGVVQQRENT